VGFLLYFMYSYSSDNVKSTKIREYSLAITISIFLVFPSLVLSLHSSSSFTSTTQCNVTSMMGPNQANKNNCRCRERPSTVIENFRQAAGIQNVYRSASPDGLADMDFSTTQQWTDSDRFVFEQAQLIVDLRSPNEVNQLKSKAWMSMAPPKGIQAIETDYSSSLQETPRCGRFAARFSVLPPPRFMSYIEEHWLNPAEKQKAAVYRMCNNAKLLSALRIEKLNDRGLFGLNQLILELGKEELCRALRTITVHLEQNPNDNVLIHCAQGKDR
jgi:hypothetical protein